MSHGKHSKMKTCKCFSCDGEYPDIEGPVHRYMLLSDKSSGAYLVKAENLEKAKTLTYSDPSYT